MELVKHNGEDLTTTATDTTAATTTGPGSIETPAQDSAQDSIETPAQDSNPEPTPSTWQSVDVGPIQAGRINKAARALLGYGSATLKLSGVKGGEESAFVVQALFGPRTNPIPNRLYCAIGERYAWTVTAKNAAAIAAELATAAQEARKSLPVVDERRTLEEEAERVRQDEERNACYRAEHDAREVRGRAILAKMPRGAKAAIVATLVEDVSDSMTDYYGTKTLRRCIIGWAFSERFSFDTCRKAAALAGASTLPEVAHLGTRPEVEPGRAHPHDEHRENYSMGHGNYLKDGSRYSCGWEVNAKTYGLDAYGLGEFEDCIPDVPAHGAQLGTSAGPVDASGTGDVDGARFTVSPGIRQGYVELRFDSKPAPEVLTRLKAAGFRWAVSSRCWYGLATRCPFALDAAAANAGGAS